MTASEWWVKFFGQGAQDANDYTGRTIKKAAYNQAGSQYGWVLEYILPLDQGGTKADDNLHIVSYEAHVLRDGKITYSIDGIRYQVQKDESGKRGVYKIGDKRVSFWEREFGDVTEATDFAGNKIIKSAYRNENSQYGWDIDHIQPLSKGGVDTDENKQIVHIFTNREKADKTTFVIDGQQYQVRKTSKADEDEWADYDYSDKKYCIVQIDQRR
ncbi:MAG: hypothetical protein LBP79_00820 [Clostridiales bacterium]|jgi:hypothetical protein|nr:hypothetical protein [Clostridiales bacterium]